MLSLILTAGFVGLMALRVPVSMAIALSTLLPLVLLDRNLVLIPQYMLEGVHSQPLLAVPFFILAGNLFNTLGLSQRIWEFAVRLAGHWRGGLGHVNVLSSMIFAGISGSALADVAGLGLIEIPAMERYGYRRPFAAAITLASAVIGPIIPPSINLVLYGVIAQVSIGKLFLAGVVPGMIIGAALMATVYWYAATGREPCPVYPRSPVRAVARSFAVNLPALVVPAIVVAGMGFGIITPTEVGVVAALYALALGIAYREASTASLWACLTTSARSTITIMFIIAISTVAGWIYTFDGTAQRLAHWLLQLTDNRVVLLLLINLFLLLMGALLEPIPLLILATPVLLPVVQRLGVDPIQFGIIMNLNITIGIITPPMGIGLYTMMGIVKISFEDLVRASLPWLVPLLACLVLFTLVPSLSLWLPQLLLGR
jgi:tripartite ATP-independent transporter DctM subunit